MPPSLGPGCVEVTGRPETVGTRSAAITQKHPVIVVGDKDVEDGTVGLRLYGED